MKKSLFLLFAISLQFSSNAPAEIDANKLDVASSLIEIANDVSIKNKDKRLGIRAELTKSASAWYFLNTREFRNNDTFTPATARTIYVIENLHFTKDAKVTMPDAEYVIFIVNKLVLDGGAVSFTHKPNSSTSQGVSAGDYEFHINSVELRNSPPNSIIKFASIGGQGGAGKDGRNGLNGKQQKCFEESSRNRHGGAGENGTDGGKGGDGGLVVVRINKPDNLDLKIISEGGVGGTGGKGGKGGKGAPKKNCTTWKRGGGNKGSNGIDGKNGEHGMNGQVIKY